MEDQKELPLHEPYLKKLIEALKILVACAKTHNTNQGGDNIPTLATLARHYNLEKTNEVLVRVLVILSKLCQSLQDIDHGSTKEAQKRFPEFFRCLEEVSTQIKVRLVIVIKEN